jgi:SSS family solute:Na+ symporter
MLLLSIVLYILLTLAIGVYASTLVKNSKDYLLAGRNLPFFMATFVAFATWFGAETVLGASSQMAKEGLWGVIEDPFGAALCLILVGIFFAKPLYRLNLLTFGDFYKRFYGRKAEIVASLLIIASYFGWIGAQMLAIGLILNITTGVSVKLGTVIGSLVVVFYTFLGGMWAVSLTDFIQTIMIIVGLLFALYEVSQGFSHIPQVLASQPPEFYKFSPLFKPSGVPALYHRPYYHRAWFHTPTGCLPEGYVLSLGKGGSLFFHHCGLHVSDRCLYSSDPCHLCKGKIPRAFET